MEWTEEIIITFIKLYEENPVLWDSTHKLYKMVNKKNDAWADIAKEMGIDVAELKKKMNSLLATYRKLRKKIEVTYSGMGTDEIQTTSWFAYKSFYFLQDKYQPKPTTSTQDTQSISGDDDNDINSKANNEDPVNNVETEEVIAGPSTSKETERTFKPPGQRVSGKRKIVEDPRVDNAYKILQETVSNRTPRDASTIFGEHIATKHRAYSTYTRNMIEHLITNILFDAVMGKYNEPVRYLSNSPLSNIPSPISSPSPQPLVGSPQPLVGLPPNNYENSQYNSAVVPSPVLAPGNFQNNQCHSASLTAYINSFDEQ